MEQKIKNKIITISGEPVSGKGTVTKELVKKLKEKGFSEENIHIISAGKEFRGYFESILNFFKSTGNMNELKNAIEDDKIVRIAKDKNYRKALISTILKIAQSNKNLEDMDIEDINKEELFTEIRSVVDFLIDGDIQQMGKEINEQKRENDVWIFDSRMAFYNIPDAFSVRLTANPKIAGQRLFNDSTRGKEDSYETIEEAEKEREGRRIAEIERYKKSYNVDLENKDNYNLIVDTSYSSVEDIADTILTCLDYDEKGKRYGKSWTSPLTMIPCQSIRETFEPQFGSDLTLDNLKKIIEKDGYNPDSEIEIFKINGINYILEGHHRNFASICAGKTLIPYIDCMETEYGKERYKKGTYPRSSTRYLFDHEAIVEDELRKQQSNPSLRFSYQSIYPNILKEIEKNDFLR